MPVYRAYGKCGIGRKEMFIKEGFDGFIAKPINTSDFERVVQRVLSGRTDGRGGDIR